MDLGPVNVSGSWMHQKLTNLVNLTEDRRRILPSLAIDCAYQLKSRASSPTVLFFAGNKQNCCALAMSKSAHTSRDPRSRVEDGNLSLQGRGILRLGRKLVQVDVAKGDLKMEKDLVAALSDGITQIRHTHRS